MTTQLWILTRGTALGVALALAVPVFAQQTPNTEQQTPTVAGTPTETPTKKDPLKFRAIAQAVENAGAAEGVTEIHIERWTTPDERATLLKLVNTAKAGERGQHDLLKALEKVKPRVGFIKLPNTLGKDLLRMKPNQKGEGKLLVASAIASKNGRLELENYANEPVRLTEITEEQKK